MVTSNKTNPRSPGRTPPFILIGLLVLTTFLAYSYWSLTNANSQLSAELDTVRIQKKDADEINSESEKKLANAKSSLSEAQEISNKVKKELESKESVLADFKTALGNKDADVLKFKDEKNQCDTNFAALKSELDTLKSQKEAVDKQLQEEKAKPAAACGHAECKAAIKDVLAVVAKSVGSDALIKTLSEAKYDGAGLMEGIQIPAPVVQQPAENKKVEEEKQPEVKKGNQVENNTSEMNSEKIQTMNVDESIGNTSYGLASDKPFANLVFLSDLNQNTDALIKNNEKQADDFMYKAANISAYIATEPTLLSTADLKVDEVKMDDKPRNIYNVDEQQNEEKLNADQHVRKRKAGNYRPVRKGK